MNSNSVKWKGGKWSRSGGLDELGQLSDKRQKNGGKENLIYVGQALNW